MKITKLLLATAFVANSTIAGMAYAQDASSDTIDPGHPRVNQVDSRIDNQRAYIQKQEATGKIDANQAAKDENRLNGVQKREDADAAKNGGHLTKAEDHTLNHNLHRDVNRDKNQESHDATRAQ